MAPSTPALPCNGIATAEPPPTRPSSRPAPGSDAVPAARSGACLLLSVAPRSWTDGQVEAAEAYAAVLAGLLELAAEAQRSAALARRVQELLARRDRSAG